MSYKITKQIDGVYEIKREIYYDKRGYFSEIVPAGLEKDLGVKFIQTNIAHNVHKYTFRGLHTQLPPFEQAKLVTVLNHEVCVFVVDVRPSSPTYQMINRFNMDNTTSIFIPEGCLHGYLTLHDDTYFHYSVTNKYDVDSEVIVSGIKAVNNYIRHTVCHISTKDYEKSISLEEFLKINTFK